MLYRFPLLQRIFGRGVGGKNINSYTTVWQVLCIHEAHFIQDGYVCVQALRQTSATEHNVFVLGLKCALKTPTIYESKKMLNYLKEYLQEQLKNHLYFKHYVFVTYHPNAKALKEGSGTGMYRVLMNDQQISGITPLTIRLMRAESVTQVCIRKRVNQAANTNSSTKQPNAEGIVESADGIGKGKNNNKNSVCRMTNTQRENHRSRNRPFFRAFSRYHAAMYPKAKGNNNKKNTDGNITDISKKNNKNTHKNNINEEKKSNSVDISSKNNKQKVNEKIKQLKQKLAGSAT